MTMESVKGESVAAIREMTAEDLPAVAIAHMQAFPGSFITRMGKGASERYYRWQLEGPHDHFPIIAVMDGRVVGFCVGGISRGSLKGYLKKYKFYLAAQIALHPSIIFNAGFFGRSATAIRSFFGKDKMQDKNTCIPGVRRESFGILAICVIPEAQGTGIAKELMVLSEAEAVRRGFSAMHLTVASENGRAIRFYEKLGYSVKDAGLKRGGTFMEKPLR